MAVELKELTKRSENYSQWYNDLVEGPIWLNNHLCVDVWLSSLTDTPFGRKCSVSWDDMCLAKPSRKCLFPVAYPEILP